MADLRLLTIYWRDMLRFVRFRGLLISSLVQPALWLAFFGIAMSSSFDVIGSQIPAEPGVPQVGYLTFMCAGVISMTTLFTSLFGGMSLIFDKNWGLLREVMAAPMSRANIVLGTGLSGITKSIIQAAIILGFGLVLGVQFFAGYTPSRAVLAIAGILAFVSVFALGFVFLSAAIAITMESPEGMQGIMTLLTMPIFFASNALYPAQAFPPALQLAAAVNPLTHMVTGIRFFAIGPVFSAIGQTFRYSVADIAVSFGALCLFATVMFLVALRQVRRARVT
ncbi:MAG: ABC transporter permease [Methanospirillum sp.]|nr:ABC transporter permease [Methanospirillum sp.]